MKKSTQLILGLLVTVAIFLFSTFIGKEIDLGSDFIPSSFGIHITMLILSVLVLVFFKNHLSFNFKLPKLKSIWRPIILAITSTVLINMSITMLFKLFGINPENHPAFDMMNPYQILVFVFLLASVAEEFLFRGFLLNILKPMQDKGFTILKRRISLPVIVSAFAFGLSHLITIKLGVSYTFLIRIVLFTTSLGLIAGYYQEKHNNFSYAVIVHMAGNLLGVIAAFAMQ